MRRGPSAAHGRKSARLCERRRYSARFIMPPPEPLLSRRRRKVRHRRRECPARRSLHPQESLQSCPWSAALEPREPFGRGETTVKADALDARGQRLVAQSRQFRAAQEGIGIQPNQSGDPRNNERIVAREHFTRTPAAARRFRASPEPSFGGSANVSKPSKIKSASSPGANASPGVAQALGATATGRRPWAATLRS